MASPWIYIIDVVGIYMELTGKRITLNMAEPHLVEALESKTVKTEISQEYKVLTRNYSINSHLSF